MNGSNHETSIQPGEIEIPFRAVAPETEECLNDKQLFDHRRKAEEFARWMLVFGKNPDQVKGYAISGSLRSSHCIGTLATVISRSLTGCSARYLWTDRSCFSRRF
jgi:hypothetical protein